MDNQPKSAFGMDVNVAAGLAYLPFCLVNLIFSIAILATDKTNKLARFHAVQSLLILGSIIVGYILFFVCMFVLMLLAAATHPSVAMLIFVLYILFIAFALAMFVGLIICMINAFQGKIFKLPIIGNFADNWSN
ncbi:MAG TPA: hypothetical protein PKA82_15570 [Pyrinomonadaceae bacterium]|nr:hypothetical protein [Pyrinomonadaceae bacterium]